MTPAARKALASVELLFAAMLWGFGFIATIWALTVFGPLEVTFLRFALAGSLIVFFLFSAGGRGALNENVRVTFLPGVLLTVTLVFQTWGLQYTTATKSGFITTLYVVFVPILESVLTKKKLPVGLWLCVATALMGTALIVNVGVDSINFGDVLTFICALAAAVQIYWLGLVSPRVRHPFAFNLLQASWGALVCFPVVFFVPLADKIAVMHTWPLMAWAGLASLTLGSTVIAFFLQVRAQAHLSPTVSSLIFLLESPFALIFALLLLGETLGFTESIGATLIFLSALAASLIEARRKKF